MAEMILAERTLSGFAASGSNYMCAMSGQLASFVENEEYTIVWDGTEYFCVASVIDNITVLGNQYFESTDNVDTGEPFLFAYVPEEICGTEGGQSAIFTSDTDESHTVAIYQGELEEESSGISIVLYDRTGQAVNYNNVETITTDTPDREQGATFTYGVAVENAEYEPDFSNGNQKITLEKGQLLKAFTMVKPENLLPEYIKKNVEVAGVIGEFAGDEAEKTVELNMAEGNQIIEADENTVLTKVTVMKPETFVPENIAKGVEIGGVVGKLTGLDDLFNKTIEEAICPTASEIPLYAFRSCKSLKNADFPVCKIISQYAFYSCIELSTISFPACQTIGTSAFYGCSKLSQISFPECSIVGSYAFACSSSTYSDHAPKFSEADFPKVSTVWNYAFAYMSTLKKASFPECTTMWYHAFAYCQSLETAYFPKCTGVGSNAFFMCKNLENAYFPNATTVGSSAFRSCVYGMKSVNFSKVTTVYQQGFWNINGWTELTPNMFPALKTIHSSAFEYNYYLTSVYLPSAQVISSCAFRGCTRLQMVSLPNCSSLYYSVFASCNALTSLYLLGTSYANLGAAYVFTSTPMSVSTYTGTFGSIFVRESMLASYKTRAYWSAFSSRFVGLTDDEIATLDASLEGGA